jgi:hypothetical protein
MAQRLVTQMTDDLDGSNIKDGAGETVRFSLDGSNYEIDLKHTNADKLRSELERYVNAGRRVTRAAAGTRHSRGSRGTAAAKPDPKDVRAWAAANGIAVSARGRIPAEVYERYAAG